MIFAATAWFLGGPCEMTGGPGCENDLPFGAHVFGRRNAVTSEPTGQPPMSKPARGQGGVMAREFWRTIQMAIEKDNWTARLVVALCTSGVAGLGVYMVGAAR
ncbi:hypothetical protein GCM10010271_71180 [Streptomyces kurssanovii]|nr:hypothetical protein GCM10010271_71180 [Streptomyces kurssanovii]